MTIAKIGTLARASCSLIWNRGHPILTLFNKNNLAKTKTVKKGIFN